MAKKSVFWGMLALALTVSFAVVGCSDPLQEGGKVKIDYDTASGVDNLTATKTTGNLTSETHKGVILTWNAVDADVPVGYQVYVQQDGKKTIANTGLTGSYGLTYDAADGDPSYVAAADRDIDSWTELVPLSATYGFVSGKSYRLGVRTTTSSGIVQGSDIVWADTVITVD
jgi:hypothetical protein